MVSIEILPEAAADDAALVAELAELINQAYTVAEKGLWRDHYGRTNTSELAALITAGEIAAARGADDRIAGAVRVQELGGGLGEFGMLACAPEQRGSGLGRALVDFAEQWCAEQGAETVQLELLVPRGWAHPVKEFLRTWYLRLGYVLERKGELEQDYPHLVPLLAAPCDFLIFHKSLGRID